VKWDGVPALVFGRKPDTGEFVLTDDSGFSAAGYDGLFTSTDAIELLIKAQKRLYKKCIEHKQFVNEMDREEKKSVKTMVAGNKTALKDKDRKKFNHANARYERIRAIRRGSTGAGSLSGANQKWAPDDERNARAETPKERHEIGAIEREHRTGRTKSTKAHPRRGE
jgi:hypothetical protein